MKSFVVWGAALKRENFSTTNWVCERIKAPELRRISFARALPLRIECISAKEDAANNYAGKGDRQRIALAA